MTKIKLQFFISPLLQALSLLGVLVVSAKSDTLSSQNEVTLPATIHTITLQQNQSYPLEGLNPSEYQIQPPGVIDAKPDSSGLIIKALKPGKAELISNYNGHELKIPFLVKESENRKLETTTCHFSFLKPQNHKLTGKIHTRRQYQEVLQCLATHPDSQFELDIAPGLKSSLMQLADSSLKAEGLKDVRIASAGNRFFLYGAVSTPIEVETAFEAVRPILANIENKLPIPVLIDPTILVKVYMLEVNKSAQEEFGLQWPQHTEGFLNLNWAGAAFGGQWPVALRHLAHRGLAKVLAEPMLSVRLGASAELFAGGEIPIKLTEKFENRLIWKHYGLKLRIQIKSISGNHIRTIIETESSHLDNNTAVGGTPGVLSNKLKTEIDAEQGKIVLLTGLIHSFSSKDIDAIPVIGDIPILGELFKSRDFKNHESELLIALLPQVKSVETRLPLKAEIDTDDL